MRAPLRAGDRVRRRPGARTVHREHAGRRGTGPSGPVRRRRERGLGPAIRRASGDPRRAGRRGRRRRADETGSRRPRGPRSRGGGDPRATRGHRAGEREGGARLGDDRRGARRSPRGARRRPRIGVAATRDAIAVVRRPRLHDRRGRDGGDRHPERRADGGRRRGRALSPRSDGTDPVPPVPQTRRRPRDPGRPGRREPRRDRQGRPRAGRCGRCRGRLEAHHRVRGHPFSRPRPGTSDHRARRLQGLRRRCGGRRPPADLRGEPDRSRRTLVRPHHHLPAARPGRVRPFRSAGVGPAGDGGWRLGVGPGAAAARGIGARVTARAARRGGARRVARDPGRGARGRHRGRRTHPDRLGRRDPSGRGLAPAERPPHARRPGARGPRGGVPRRTPARGR